jgi:NAD(P)-dependent dehydrogenase (short-subunit alcohol dehydrogenase family)
VSTPELVEVMFVNAVSPFVLNSRLQPLMVGESVPKRDRYIVNVSAMEGKFYRYKTPNHPHTNMAKAALNMMTRTSAEVS